VYSLRTAEGFSYEAMPFSCPNYPINQKSRAVDASPIHNTKLACSVLKCLFPPSKVAAISATRSVLVLKGLLTKGSNLC
jgi:hypothetical protein